MPATVGCSATTSATSAVCRQAGDPSSGCDFSTGHEAAAEPSHATSWKQAQYLHAAHAVCPGALRSTVEEHCAAQPQCTQPWPTCRQGAGRRHHRLSNARRQRRRQVSGHRLQAAGSAGGQLQQLIGVGNSTHCRAAAPLLAAPPWRQQGRGGCLPSERGAQLPLLTGRRSRHGG